jgi:hypothetical protein
VKTQQQQDTSQGVLVGGPGGGLARTSQGLGAQPMST